MNPGLCLGSPTLGQKGPTTPPQWTSPICGICVGAMLCNGATDDLFGQGNVRRGPTIQLAGHYTIQAEGPRATSQWELPQFKSQQELLSPHQGNLQDDWEWEMALNTHCGSYSNIKGHPVWGVDVRLKSAATLWPWPPPGVADIA